MDVEMIFKIAAIGIIVSILNQVLSRSGSIPEPGVEGWVGGVVGGWVGSTMGSEGVVGPVGPVVSMGAVVPGQGVEVVGGSSVTEGLVGWVGRCRSSSCCW